jgi:hypothetical protein
MSDETSPPQPAHYLNGMQIIRPTPPTPEQRQDWAIRAAMADAFSRYLRPSWRHQQ